MAMGTSSVIEICFLVHGSGRTAPGKGCVVLPSPQAFTPWCAAVDMSGIGLFFEVRVSLDSVPPAPIRFLFIG